MEDYPPELEALLGKVTTTDLRIWIGTKILGLTIVGLVYFLDLRLVQTPIAILVSIGITISVVLLLRRYHRAAPKLGFLHNEGSVTVLATRFGPFFFEFKGFCKERGVKVRGKDEEWLQITHEGGTDRILYVQTETSPLYLVSNTETTTLLIQDWAASVEEE